MDKSFFVIIDGCGNVAKVGIDYFSDAMKEIGMSFSDSVAYTNKTEFNKTVKNYINDCLSQKGGRNYCGEPHAEKK